MCFNRVRLACCVVLLIAGCGAERTSSMGNAGSSDIAVAQRPPDPADKRAGDLGPANGGPQAAAQRKIIRTAELRLFVDDLTSASAKISQVAVQMQGYVANSSLSGASGRSRQGTWKVRIPVQAYDQFLSVVQQFGEVQSLSTDSQDVTAEFFDLEARLHNKQQEEVRLLKHLDQSSGKLDEILNVERELSRVREEIERLQGRRNLLQDITAMTTVTVHLIETSTFAPVVARTFMGRISQSFFGSLNLLRSAAIELLVLVVALSPWLAVFGTLALVVWGLRRVLRLIYGWSHS